MSNIMYIKVADKYCKIYTKDEEYLVSSRMCDLEKAMS